MPDAYSFILDAPTGEPRNKLQIAKLGKGYRDPRYGTFDITEREVKSWQANLAKLPGQRAVIDLDHAADRVGAARNTEAAGWITGVELDDGTPTATVEWTPVGEQAIRDKRYLFFSPTYGPWTDEQGVTHRDTLIGGALTNRPFLNMPAICLAKAGFVEGGEPITGDPDSRPVMPDLLKTLAKLHGLPEDADEAKVLEAATNAKTAADAKPPESTDTKTLEARAADEGKVLLDSATVTKYLEDAAKGVKAESDLATMQFENAFDTALKSGRIDARPETKALHQGIFAIDREKSIKLLESLPEGVVNLSARGEGGDHGETPTTLDGHEVDPESAKLNQKVKARMLDKGEDYMTALNAIHEGSMVL